MPTLGIELPEMGFRGAVNMPAVTTSNRTGLADALFSQTRQKVLRLFFARQERDFSIKELIEQAEAGSGAVQRELARLVDSPLCQGSWNPTRC